MFPPSRYLPWAIRFYGQVPFDLATSGTPIFETAELGDPGRSEPASVLRLRSAIARHNDVPELEAVATLGGTHAIWLVYATLLTPGDEVLVESPAYEPLVSAALGVGAVVNHFERRATKNFALDPARVAAAITNRTRLVVVTNLHNPSGARASDDVLLELAKICEARGAHLLVDEVYAPFDAIAGANGVWKGSARKLAPNVIAIGSLTKCYGLGRERIGWVLGPEDVIARAADTLLMSCGALPLVHAQLGAHAFTCLDKLARRSRDLLAGKREVVERWIATRPDLTWSAPTSGLFGFAISTRSENMLARIERAATEHGVLVAPGSFFGIPSGFRLAWSIDRALLDEGLARLGRALDD
ncbi:MAG: pyridoxal phosphate-dependent aminotransferase [Polyangiaceae bacterium]